MEVQMVLRLDLRRGTVVVAIEGVRRAVYFLPSKRLVDAFLVTQHRRATLPGIRRLREAKARNGRSERGARKKITSFHHSSLSPTAVVGIVIQYGQWGCESSAPEQSGANGVARRRGIVDNDVVLKSGRSSAE